MLNGKRIAVVVPAHNEVRLIVQAVKQVPEFVDDIIVVDDASTDGTLHRLQSSVVRKGLCSIRHRTNGGVGAAIVTGYKKALMLGAEVVAVMAGDAQMDPEDLPKLLAPVIDGKAEYAKGDRLSWPGVAKTMPVVRFVGNHLLSFITRFTSGYRQVRDSQCGYTAVSAKTLSALNLDRLYQRYGFPNDMLAHLFTRSARLEQVPVRPIYGPERSEISLFTVLFAIPWVLVRSFWYRRTASGKHTLPVTVSTKGS